MWQERMTAKFEFINNWFVEREREKKQKSHTNFQLPHHITCSHIMTQLILTSHTLTHHNQPHHHPQHITSYTSSFKQYAEEKIYTQPVTVSCNIQHCLQFAQSSLACPINVDFTLRGTKFHTITHGIKLSTTWSTLYSAPFKSFHNCSVCTISQCIIHSFTVPYSHRAVQSLCHTVTVQGITEPYSHRARQSLCHTVTVQGSHCAIQSLWKAGTVPYNQCEVQALCHTVTVQGSHGAIQSLCSAVNVPYRHRAAQSLCHTVTVQCSHCAIQSLCSAVTVPYSHCAVQSLCHTVTM